jgi:hypothetical protein
MSESINLERRRFFGAAAAALGAARFGVVGSAVQQMACAALTERDEGVLPSLSGATEWLNSSPLTPAGLRGKVVLVDFWTYTCVSRNRAARSRRPRHPTRRRGRRAGSRTGILHRSSSYE